MVLSEFFFYSADTKYQERKLFLTTGHEAKGVCFRCTGNVKTLQLLFSIEDNKAEQVRGL